MTGSITVLWWFFYRLLLLIFATVTMQAGTSRSNLTYIHTYSGISGKSIVSRLPPTCMKGRDLILNKVQVGSSSSIASTTGAPILVPDNNKNLLEIVDNVSAKEGVNPFLVRAIIQTESGFCVKAKSRSGALGLMQLMPCTARRFGVLNVFNPYQNITGGVKYLKWLISNFKGDLCKAVAAYNAGEAAVTKHNGVPPFAETRAYVPMVLKRYYHYIAHPNYCTRQNGIHDNSTRTAHIKKSEHRLRNTGNLVTYVSLNNTRSSGSVYCWPNALGRIQITDCPPPKMG